MNARWQEYRSAAFTFLAVVIFGLVWLRLFQLQVLGRPGFQRAAEANYIRAEIMEPPRGRIYDRNGVLVVTNRPAYSLYAQPWVVRRNPQVISELASLLSFDSTLVRSRISAKGWSTFRPAAVIRDLEPEKLAKLEALQLDLPGILFQLEPKRYYLVPEACHLLGYVGERSPEEAAGTQRFGLVGKRGVEKTWERFLGGTPGVRYLQVDANGRVVGEGGYLPPTPVQPGWDLYLNLDSDLQRLARQLMEGEEGAVVALDPHSGGILTMVSTPDYDPEVFTGIMPAQLWQALNSDPSHPLLNRAIQGVYPPGSTFKMTVMTAALEQGVAGTERTVHCPGGLQVGSRWFSCWNKGGHGSLDPVSALQRSCDVFFYTMGLSLGIERLEPYVRKFNFGRPTRVDLDGEYAGLAPTLSFFNRRYGAGRWPGGILANIAIGQGEVLVTPLQLAVYAAGIATGRIAKPRVADRLVNPRSGEVFVVPVETTPLDISERTLNLVREGMRRVVNEPGGTAYWLRRPEYQIAGKTGTSQNPHGKDHALFVAYAPYEDPQIAVAVVVEHGEHGSTTAAPIACKIIDRYLNYVPVPVETAASATEIGPDSAATDTLVGD